MMKIQEFNLNALSHLSYKIRICNFESKWNPCAVILEFSGKYRSGSEGNPDATFIKAIKAATLAIINANAVIYDFQNMYYEWGNGIWDVFYHPEEDENFKIPEAMVISEKCKNGFSSCEIVVPPMFESLEDALRYIETPIKNRVNDLMKDIE